MKDGRSARDHHSMLKILGKESLLQDQVDSSLLNVLHETCIGQAESRGDLLEGHALLEEGMEVQFFGLGGTEEQGLAELVPRNCICTRRGRGGRQMIVEIDLKSLIEALDGLLLSSQNCPDLCLAELN